MPRYISSRDGEFQGRKKRSFVSPNHIIHFLSTARDQDWEPFKNIAIEYATNKRTPPKRLNLRHVNTVASSKPRDLVPHVINEFNSHVDPDRESLLGGGIADVIHTVGHTVGHLFGLDKLSDAIFGGPTQKERSYDSEIAAYLVDQTYKPPKERPFIGVDGYKRLQKYDSDFYSVWEKPDGELLVTIRGTKLNHSDIGSDMKILVGTKGGKLDSLDPLFDQLEKDFPNTKYNTAAHSLGTSYLLKEFPEHRDNMNEVFLFNVASSPLQSEGQLENIANQNAQYYVNSSDLVSSGAYGRMNRETIDNNLYLADYTYSPIAAHSLTQWYNEDDMKKEQHEQYLATPKKEEETTSFDVAELQQDTEETRAEGLS